MANDFRGGNSRTLAKSLDFLVNPTAILDRRGQIVFANSALCQMAKADATQLVGQQCSWEVASDDRPFSAILTAIAPPTAARNGRIASRQLSTPVVFGSDATGQLFIPLLDEDELVHLTLVVFGDWNVFHRQIPAAPNLSLMERRQIEQTLVAVRSRWPNLDDLHPLIGSSPAICLAMNRAQLAIATRCNVLIHGPSSAGTSRVARGIFSARLKLAGMPKIAGQYFPIDCSVLDTVLIDGMLEVFAGRLRSEASPQGQQLVLENLDRIPEPAVLALNLWLERFGTECVTVALSEMPTNELTGRGPEWHKLIATVGTTEIQVPPLRERREDIAPLVHHALAESCRKADRALLTVAPDAMALLEAFSWPNNYLQLNEAIESSVKHAVLTSAVQVQHLPVEVRTFPSSIRSADDSTVEAIVLDDLLADIERIILRRALKLSPRNRAQVARWLNISRPRLLRRISQLGLQDQAPPEDLSEDDEEKAE